MSVDPTSEEDDIEEPIDDEEDEVDEELPSSDDVSYAVSSKAPVEAIEDFSIASRQKIRAELEAQMAAFLARGGKIDEVKPNVTADPPKKPAPDYGGRPI